MNGLKNNALKESKELLNQAWDIVKARHGDKAKKVKKIFVTEMTGRLLNKLAAYCINKNCHDLFPPVEEVMEYVFTYHYFYTGRLSDAERSAKQRSEEYKEIFHDSLYKILLCELYDLHPVSVATKYQPEIASTRFLCDSLIQILRKNPSPIVCERGYEQRFSTIYNLFLSALGMIKSIVLQLVDSFPSNATITWRALLELEYKIFVLVKYDNVLEDRYREFASFEFAEEETTPESYAALCEYAEVDGFDPSHMGYRHYGWLLAIKDFGKLTPSFKSLLKVAEDEERYTAFRLASSFVHSSSGVVFANEKLIYHFLINQLFVSTDNIINALAEFLRQYAISFAEDDEALKLYNECKVAHNSAKKQYCENYAHDKRESGD